MIKNLFGSYFSIDSNNNSYYTVRMFKVGHTGKNIHLLLNMNFNEYLKIAEKYRGYSNTIEDYICRFNSKKECESFIENELITRFDIIDSNLFKNVDGLKLRERYDDCNNIVESIYYDENYYEHNNDDKPAHIKYYSGDYNKIRSVCYSKHGNIHRENGPAFIGYNTNGQINSYRYYINGKLHNEYGPASYDYSFVGSNLIHYCYKGIDCTNLCKKYKNKLTSRMIKINNDINHLMAMKIICNEQQNLELLELVNNKIVLLKLENQIN